MGIGAGCKLLQPCNASLKVSDRRGLWLPHGRFPYLHKQKRRHLSAFLPAFYTLLFHKNDGIIPEILPGLPLTDPDFYPLLPESPAISCCKPSLHVQTCHVLWMFLPSGTSSGNSFRISPIKTGRMAAFSLTVHSCISDHQLIWRAWKA